MTLERPPKMGEATTGWHGIATRRFDWQQVCIELFSRVLHTSPAGICVVSKEQTLMGSTLRFRSNQLYPDSFAAKSIRCQFTMSQFHRVFWRSEDVVLDPNRPVYRVVSSDLGIPQGCRIVRVASRAPVKEAALVVFGGDATGLQLDDCLAEIQIVALRVQTQDDGPPGPPADPQRLP